MQAILIWDLFRTTGNCSLLRLETHPIQILAQSSLRFYDDLLTVIIPVATLGHSRALCIVRAAGWESLEVLNRSCHLTTGCRSANTYTKLHLWSLDILLGVPHGYIIDADTLVRRNFDELFDLPFPFTRRI